MATPGDTFSTILQEVWTPELITSVFKNNALLGGGVFDIVPAPAGDKISTGYIYSVTANGGTYSYDDAMADADSTSQVKAYFNKDWYQTTARIFGQYVDSHAGGAGNAIGVDYARRAMEEAMGNLRDIINTTMITDVTAQVDSAGNYSDAALTRSTYDMTSFETAVSGALALSHLEDAIEGLENGITYGPAAHSDLVILMPRNQLTNLARLGAGVGAGYPLVVQQGGNVDVGRVANLASYDGIPIYVIPDMSTQDILILNKPDIKIYETRMPRIEAKTELADTQIWNLTASYNIVAHTPRKHAKLSALTA